MHSQLWELHHAQQVPVLSDQKMIQMMVHTSPPTGVFLSETNVHFMKGKHIIPLEHDSKIHVSIVGCTQVYVFLVSSTGQCFWALHVQIINSHKNSESCPWQSIPFCQVEK